MLYKQTENGNVLKRRSFHIYFRSYKITFFDFFSVLQFYSNFFDNLHNPAATRSRNCFQSPIHLHFFTNTLTLCRLLASLLSKSLSTECIKLCCSDDPNTTKAIALAAKTYRISLARGVCVKDFYFCLHILCRGEIKNVC